MFPDDTFVILKGAAEAKFATIAIKMLHALKELFVPLCFLLDWEQKVNLLFGRNIEEIEISMDNQQIQMQ